MTTMKNPMILLPYTLSLIALFCMMVMLATNQPGYLYGGTRYDVRITNGFSDNSSLPLVIWCGSEESSMGGRALQERDDYSWTLDTGYWPLFTSFWKIRGQDTTSGDIRSDVHCTMKWDRKRKKFEAFRASRDSQRCRPFKLCLWLVKEDGFYFSNDGFNYHKEFSWP